jgi:hypothetical protein
MENFNEGDKVRGTYYRQPYLGKVVEARWHSCENHKLYTVLLDEPIKVYGLFRTRIQVSDPDTYGSTNIAAAEG